MRFFKGRKIGSRYRVMSASKPQFVEPLPPLPNELFNFVKSDPVKGTLSSEAKSAAEGVCKSLHDLKKAMKKKGKPAKCKVSKIPTWNIPKLPKDVLFVYKVGSRFIARLENDRKEFFTWSVGTIEQMSKYVKAHMRNAFFVACDFAGFRQWIDDEYQNRQIVKRTKQAKLISRWLRRRLSDLGDLERDSSDLQHMCAELEGTVVVKEEWCPMNEFDFELPLYLQSRELIKEMDKIAMDFSNGSIESLSKYFEKLEQRLQLKTPNQKVVLQNGLSRLVFDVCYVMDPSRVSFAEGSAKFFAKCNYIASFSPRALDLSEHLFTPQQMDTPMINLARENPHIREISAELSSLQFYTCTTDLLHKLQAILTGMDDIARYNELERKLGQFANMIEEDQMRQKKKVQFMSFDDLMSLLFSILAVDPPRNALALCAWLESVPDITMSQQIKYAKTAFIGAIQHIMNFTEEQLVKTDDDADDDPLGITKQ